MPLYTAAGPYSRRSGPLFFISMFTYSYIFAYGMTTWGVGFEEPHDTCKDEIAAKESYDMHCSVSSRLHLDPLSLRLYRTILGFSTMVRVPIASSSLSHQYGECAGGPEGRPHITPVLLFQIAHSCGTDHAGCLGIISRE